MKITKKQLRKMIQEQSGSELGTSDPRERAIRYIEREVRQGVLTSDDVIQLIRFGSEMLDDIGGDSHELWTAVAEYFYDQDQDGPRS